MNQPYKTIEKLSNGFQLSTDEIDTLLISEIKSIQRKMSVLPTSRESEALPELEMLKTIAENLISEKSNFEKLLLQNEKLEKLIIEDLFEFVCNAIIKAKIYNNKNIVFNADLMFMKLVKYCSKQLSRDKTFHISILNIIIDKSAEYYKSNGRESIMSWPFGEPLEIDSNIKQMVDNLIIGTQIDCVKSTSGKKCWSRAIYQGQEFSMIKVDFINDKTEQFIHNRYYEIAPVGSRSLDFEWRQNIKVGDEIDVFTFRNEWQLNKVFEIEHELNQRNEQINILKIQRIPPDEFEKEIFSTINAHSSSLAQPRRYSGKDHSGVDDSDDAIFLAGEKKKRWAIMRSFSGYYNSSAFLVKYLNIFGENGGFDHILNYLDNMKSDNIGGLVKLLQSSSDYLLEEFISENGKKLINKIQIFAIDQAEKNLRNISPQQLMTIIDGLTQLALRIYPIQIAKNETFETIFRIVILCIKCEFLDKQFFGAKMINEIETKSRDDKGNQRKKLSEALQEEKVFERFIKGHPSLIGKSSGALRILFSEGKVTEEQLELLWERLVKSDIESRNALISVVKEIFYDFTLNEIKNFVKKIKKGFEDINNEMFELLLLLKKIAWTRFGDEETIKMTNEIIWKLIQQEKPLKKELCKEAILYIVKCIDAESEQNYVIQIIDFISNKVNITRNLKLLGKIIKIDKNLNDFIIQKIKSSNLVSKIVEDIQVLYKQKTDRKKSNENELSDEISPRLKFLTQIVFIDGGQSVLQFTHVNQIIDTLFINDKLDDSIMNWLKNYITNNSYLEEYQKFFNSNLQKLLNLRSVDFSKLFILLFYRINILNGKLVKHKVNLESPNYYNYKSSTKYIYLLGVEAENLEGLQLFFDVYMKCQNEELEIMLANFLTRIYYPPDHSDYLNISIYESQVKKFFQIIRNLILNSFQQNIISDCRKCSLLFEKIIRKEESSGFNQLLPFNSLKESDKILIYIEKDQKNFKERFKIFNQDNDSLFNVKQKIAAEYKMTLNSFSINKENGEELDLTQMSSTLEQIQLKSGDTLIVKELEIVEIDDIPLLDQKGLITEQAILVLKEIFYDYSSNGQMTKDNLAKFVSDATDKSLVTLDDDRVLRVFSQNQKINEDFVSENDFLDFYISACQSQNGKTSTVRQNLTALGYGKSLLLKHPTVKNKNSLRDQISRDDDLNRVLLKLYSNGENRCVQLVNFLTPNYSLIQNLVQDPLKLLRQNPDLKKYFFTIIHALIFQNENFIKIAQNGGFSINQIQLQNLIQTICSQEFLELILEDLTNFKSSNKEDCFEKIEIELILLEKILKSAVSITKQDFLDDIKNLISYSYRAKQKKEKNLECLEEDKNQKNKLNSRQKIKKLFPTNQQNKEEGGLNSEEDNLEYSKLKTLISQIDSKIFIDFLQNINYPRYNNILVQILGETISISELKKHSKIILKKSLNSLLSSLIQKPSELSILLKAKQFQDLMFKGLANDKIMCRLYFKNFYAYLTSQSENVEEKATFFNLIIENINSSPKSELNVLIDLASNLLTEIADSKQIKCINKQLNLIQLFSDFGNKLILHNSDEKIFDDKEDILLISLFNILDKILKADQQVLKEINFLFKQKLIIHVFKNCLFDVNNERILFENIKTKSKKSRASAQFFLVAICKADNKAIMLALAIGFHPLCKFLPDSSLYQLDLEKKNQLGYIGIKNLGCVCYMIAMLQQFYCVPAFRYGVLMADDGKQPEMKMLKGRTFDDNVFHELQRMFAYLDQSERKDFNPVDFCLSYKDMTGDPINVMIQQDASEFLNMIFDKMENSLKGTPFKSFLESIFAGKNCNVFTCKGCGFVRSNEELFLNLSLEVKNMENIHASFEKFNSEETISDYLCDSCKKKCDISKQCYLKNLPNVLIIHLQKIIFDLDSLINVKISSKYEFPQTINLKKYVYKENETPENKNEKVENDIKNVQTDKETTEQKINIDNDEDYEYKLVGVVVHKGNAEFGHYISLINVNRQDPGRKDQSSDLWLEFDDSKISKFDMANFVDECFGGTKDDKDFAAFSSLLQGDSEISKSAYILVYDKKVKTTLKFFFNDENKGVKQKIIQDLLIDKTKYKETENQIETEFYNINKFIPDKFESLIQKDNQVLIFEQQLLSNNFPNTFVDILNEISFTQSDNDLNPEFTKLTIKISEILINILPQYLLKIFCIGNENQNIRKIIKILENALLILPEKILPFFQEHIFNNIKYLCNIIINNQEQYVKNTIAEYVALLVNLLVKQYKIKFTQNYEQTQQEQEAENLLRKFLIQIWSLIPQNDQIQNTYRKLANVFYLIEKIFQVSKSVVDFFIKSNMLKFFHDLYMGQESNRIQTHEVSLTHVLQIIAYMLDQVQTNIKQSNEPQKLQEFYDSFCNIDLFSKILKEDYRFNSFEALQELVFICCYDNILLSQKLIQLCLKGICSFIDLDLIGYLECLKCFLKIEDQYFKQRIRLIFGEPRLIETKVNTKQEILFGLGKESYLKKAVFNYTCMFGVEKGFIDQIFYFKDYNESSCLLLIYYFYEFAQLHQSILEYILNLPPYNYLSATIFDWMKIYIETQLRNLPNSYNAPKAELQSFYLNTLPSKTLRFKEQIVDLLSKYLKIDKENLNIFLNEQNMIHSKNKNYIIGKTISQKVLDEVTIDQDDSGSFSIKIQLFNVLLIESQPMGNTNKVIPSECLSYDNYINRMNIKNKKMGFFIGVDENNEDEQCNISPLIEDEEIQPTKQNISIKNEKEVPNKENEILKYNLISNDYILRLSFTNECDEYYYAKIKIVGNKNKNYNQEIMMFIKGQKDELIQNIVKIQPEDTFEGLKILISLKRTNNLTMKSYNDEDFSEFIEIFQFKQI